MVVLTKQHQHYQLKTKNVQLIRTQQHNYLLLNLLYEIFKAPMSLPAYYYLSIDYLILTLQALSIFGNGFIICLFVLFKRLRRNISLRLLWLLCCTDWVFAVSALPYIIYYITHWDPNVFDYSPRMIITSGSPLIIQFKVNLVVTIAIAVDRLQAMRMPVYYREKRQMLYVWMTLLVGLLTGAIDTAIMFLTTFFDRHVYNCAAIGCFQNAEFRAYWGISNMFLNSIALLLTIWFAYELNGFKNKNPVRLNVREQKTLAQANRLSFGILLISMVFMLIPSVFVGIVDLTRMDVFKKVGPFYIVGLLFSGVSNSVIYITLHVELRKAASAICRGILQTESSSTVHPAAKKKIIHFLCNFLLMVGLSGLLVPLSALTWMPMVVEGCFGAAQSQMAQLKAQLGGDIEIDLSTLNPLIKYPSLLGQFKISYPCDLNCKSFDGLGTPICRWRNEWTTCSMMGDELDWIRARNSWGRDEGQTIFGTEETASHCYILVGSQQKLPDTSAALLVSDPVQCQEGDGTLKFRFWTSPKTEIRVCTRKPGMGKYYDWCSCPITKGDPGPIAVVIPGSIMTTFEIVIEASHFSFDAFGVQGGIVIIDDITYDAPAVYNCRYIPHVDPPIPIAVDTCKTLYCTFDDGRCLDRIHGSGWRVSKEPTGNMHTGIRTVHDESFAYSKGVGTKTLRFGKFVMARDGLLEFCYYIATRDVFLKVYSKRAEFQRSMMFQSEGINLRPHYWICRQMVLHAGAYESLEFIAEDVPNGYAYIGLDGIRLLDPQNYQDMCTEQLNPNPNPAFIPYPIDQPETIASPFTNSTSPTNDIFSEVSEGEADPIAIGVDDALPLELDNNGNTLESFDSFHHRRRVEGRPIIKINKLKIEKKGYQVRKHNQTDNFVGLKELPKRRDRP
uniref:G_PROTEIN_RECEP_F1_2 domain-containing protein n=1 Tax=Panagrellus redivivus TaxID=6233 RepID=A0A7E4VJ28_PANRE